MKKTIFKLILFVIFLLTFFGLFIIDIKIASGESMQPKIKDGSILIISKIAYGIKHPFKNEYIIRWATPSKNDIVVLKMDNRFIVKTCYAENNECLRLYIEHKIDKLHYYIFINNKNIQLNAEEFRRLGGYVKNAVVPNNSILVFGENISVSQDSRHFGFVSYDSIYGKIIWM